VGRKTKGKQGHALGRGTAAAQSAGTRTNAHGWFEQGCAYHQQGLLAEAERCYRQTVEADPQHGDGWRNLGALLRKRGALQEACACTERSLGIRDSDPALWGNYGNVLRDLELYEQSLTAFRRGLERAPGNPGLLQGMAITLGRQGRHQEVVTLLGHLLEANTPEGGNDAMAELLLELGNAFHLLQQPQRALQCWQKGTHSAVGEKRLHIGLNTAQALCEQKRFTEALTVCEDLQRLFPRQANLLYAQGVIAKGLGKIQQACELFDAALAAEPAYPICLNTYGLMLRDIGRIHQARTCFEQALEHDPQFGPAMNNLGSVLKDVTRYEEALHWLRRGADAMADSPAAHSNVLFTLVGYELEPAQQRFEEAQRFAKKVCTGAYPRCHDRVLDPDPNRVLKVGLVSPDFCRHAVSYFVEPLLEHWDRDQLEITLYSCGEQIDDYSARLQDKADHWRDLRGQPDELAIAQIQRDEIDLLIDLAGHTAGNRLPLFAAKPAPIQATYLGYYGTTGLQEVDYWISDETLHPPARDEQDPCSEERWRLPRCYVSYRPLPEAPNVQPPPCVRQGWITFGSFNQSRKITEQTARHWMAVLEAIPQSRLLLKSKNLGEANEQERIRELFSRFGLTMERLELRGHSTTVADHLNCYAEIDIALDTYPYTGCTTTADALWMGVPVLTVAGESMVSRQAAAVLVGAGRPEWICSNTMELIQAARSLCDSPELLKQQRLRQREQVAASDLLNHRELAGSLQQAFRQWWWKWLKQQGWEGCTSWREANTHHLSSMVPLANRPQRLLPLWVGQLPGDQAERVQQAGYSLLVTASLETWGGTLTQAFRRLSQGERVVVHWPAEGWRTEQVERSLEWWKSVYPQLCWQRLQKLEDIN
jgi:protein O-GlcNAc transferase